MVLAARYAAPFGCISINVSMAFSRALRREVSSLGAMAEKKLDDCLLQRLMINTLLFVCAVSNTGCRGTAVRSWLGLSMYLPTYVTRHHQAPQSKAQKPSPLQSQQITALLQISKIPAKNPWNVRVDTRPGYISHYLDTINII
jgi:hypothetical protein